MTIAEAPPQNTDAEESVLGAMLRSPEAIEAVLDTGLKQEHFYLAKNGFVHRAITRLLEHGQATDVIGVQNFLEKHGKLEAAGGIAQIRTLSITATATANAAHHARIVVEKAIRRRLIRTTGEISKLAWEGVGDPDELRIRLEQLIEADEDLPANGDFRPLADITAYHFESLIAGERADKVPLGFPYLDKALNGGLANGTVLVLGARPGIGKSALALNIAGNVTKGEKAVAIFSAEMSEQETLDRWLSREARIAMSTIQSHSKERPLLLPEELAKLREIYAALSERRLTFNGNPSVSPGQLHAQVSRLKRRGEVDLLIVDYLQLIVRDPESAKSSENRQNEVAAISRALKRLAKELEIPVICLSALNRNLESRENKRPNLADLRDSGAIESDADVVAFLYHPNANKMFKGGPGDAKKAQIYEQAHELIIDKNRMGERTTVKLLFRGGTQSFATPAREALDAWPSD